MIAPDITATTALSAVLAAPDLDAAKAAARAGLDRIAADAPPDVMEVDEAATLVGRKPCTIRRWCAQRGVGRKLGTRWIVFRGRLVAVVEGGR